MTVLAASLLLVALAAVPIGRALTGDYFAPPALVVLAWCGTLGLYALRLLPYGPMSTETIALIAGAVLLLAGGAALASWLGARGLRATPVTSAAAVTVTVPLAPAWWTTAYAAIGFAGTAWYVGNIVTRLGVGAFLDGEGLRAALNRGDIPSTFLFLQYFALPAALLAYALWQTGHLRARHLLLPGLCALGTLVTTDRTQSFVLLVTAFFITLFRLGPRLPVWKFSAAAIVLPLLLIVNFIAVGAWRGQSWRLFQTQVAGNTATVWQGPARQLSMLYFYATASYPALDAVRQADAPRTGGVLTMYPVARALERLRLIDGPLPPYIPTFVPVAPAARDGAPALTTNASTFLYYPLRDFGGPGALAYALLVGLVSGAAYAWLRRARSSPARLLLAAQIGTALLLTVFVNKFNNTGSWYVLVVSLAPFVLGERRSAAGAWRGSRGGGS